MKEQEVRPQSEAQLTRSKALPRLEEGTIFMADNSTVETQHSPVVQASEASRASAFEETRNQWYQKFPDYSKDPHSRSVIRMLAERGIGPDGLAGKSMDKKEIGRIVAEMKEKKDDPQVLANAAIKTDKERKEKVQEFFQRSFNKTLSNEQLSAVIDAHKVGIKPDGSFEEGRDGLPAAVYNYTDKQLEAKLNFLKKVHLSFEESRALIEEGYAGATVAPPDSPATETERATRERAQAEELSQLLTNTPLESLARDVINLWDTQNLSEEQIEALLTDARNTPNADVAQREVFSKMLREARGAIAKKESQIYQSRERSSGDRVTYFKLRQRDFQELDESVTKWLNGKFDTLYAASHGRDPAQSPVLGEIEAAYGEAVRYLDKGIDRDAEAEKVQRLGDLFEARIRLMTMNSAISSKSIESIQKGSYGLRAHGLLAGYDLDNGYTGALANRMAELLEDERLKLKRGHMTPELANKIQDMVLEESKRLRGNPDDPRTGVGIHAGKKDPDILRAVRSAYDIVVDTQRMHILASRGKQLFGADAFFSDAGAAFKSFNPKTFVSEKWGLLTPTDERFTREVIETRLIDDWLETKRKKYPKLTLDEDQRKELGDILFKTIASPPDFFSSSWRIKGMKDQLHNLFAYKEAEKLAIAQGRDINNLSSSEWSALKSLVSNDDVEAKASKFGLFIRLKKDEDERPQIWGKIVEYRPEEVIRLLREKYSEPEMEQVDHAIFGQGGAINGYDSFKKEYGATIRAIREEYLAKDDPEQINFGNLTDAQKRDIDAKIGSTQRQFIEKTYKDMQKYIKDNNIVYAEENGIKVAKGSVIDKDYRFTDIYNKTLVTDDILVGKLEMLTKPQLASGMRKLSDLWSSDLGGDGFVRNMNDLASGHRYVDEQIGFIRATETEEKIKHAQAAATAVSDYDGRAGMAKVLDTDLTSYMWSAMPPDVMDILGIDKLPMRLKMTKLESIYGPHAHPLSQEKRREEFDKIEALLESSVQGEIDELLDKINHVKNEPGLTEEKRNKEIAELKEKIHKKHEAGHKIKEHAERVLKIRGRDLAYQKIAELAFYTFVLAILGEGVIVLTSAASASGIGSSSGGH